MQLSFRSNLMALTLHKTTDKMNCYKQTAISRERDCNILLKETTGQILLRTTLHICLCKTCQHITTKMV